MRNGPEECSSHLLRGGSLKTHLNLVPSLRTSEVVPTSTGLRDSPSLRFNGHQELKQAADHSLPSTAEVNNEWRYISIPPYVLISFRVTNLPLPLPLLAHKTECKW